MGEWTTRSFSSGASAVSPERLGPSTAGLKATVDLRMRHVPTGIVHLLDPEENPLISITIEVGAGQARRLRVVSCVEGYSARAIDTLEMGGRNERTRTIHQLPIFLQPRAREVAELTRASLSVLVEDLDRSWGSGVEIHASLPIWLLARSTFRRALQDPKTQAVAFLDEYLGAWITPYTAEVTRLLAEASRSLGSEAMLGIAAEPERVERQVEAIYQALRAAEIAYVHSPFSFVQDAKDGPKISEIAHYQRVRLPSETLRDRAANCLDYALLMASLLEAAQIDAAIAILPRHVLVGWRPEMGKAWRYLELTRLDALDFAAASAEGQARFEQGEALAKELGNPDYCRVTRVAAMRARRIMPME